MSLGDGKKRLVRSRSGLRFVSLEDGNNSPFELTEPFWIPDSEASSCMKCQKKFDFLTRRHHCRRCGNVYCNHCCEKKMPLQRMCFVDPVRICDSCHELTKKENDFYEKHLKVLISGANFFLDDPTIGDHGVSIFCCLSPNQQSLIFDGGNLWQHEPVPLTSTVTLKVIGTGGSPGVTQVSGAILEFVDSEKLHKELVMSVASVPNRKQTIAWINALQKAVRLINPVPASP